MTVVRTAAQMIKTTPQPRPAAFFLDGMAQLGCRESGGSLRPNVRQDRCGCLCRVSLAVPHVCGADGTRRGSSCSRALRRSLLPRRHLGAASVFEAAPSVVETTTDYVHQSQEIPNCVR